MKSDTNNPTYSVTYSHGVTTYHDTYAEAMDAVLQVYSTAEIGHDGDLTDGGDRTLCWSDAKDAENDDGVRACATIRPRFTQEVTRG